MKVTTKNTNEKIHRAKIWVQELLCPLCAIYPLEISTGSAIQKLLLDFYRSFHM
jgi:hypothetical protein